MRRLFMFVMVLWLSTATAYAYDFNSHVFTPWDVQKASKQVQARHRKPYTILLYMNGSDLESEAGAATDDLIQIMGSGMDAANVHFVVLTGGTNRWQNKVIPANQCVLWEIEDGLLYKTAEIGKLNMGDPGTLSGFITFGLQNYPADKYGLILWDHGGGSIVGYGHDEKFVEGNLTLLDMKNAFEQAGLRHNKLELLGFDSCLMATVEMAVVAADYAKVLVASEDLEPGEGWNYNFLNVLNENPTIDGATLGKVIVDDFMAYYGADSDEILSLSVADLRYAQPVMDAVGELMRLGYDQLKQDKPAAFNGLAKRRLNTKTFGEGSPRDNESDMVDIGDMAAKLADLYPTQAANVLAALNQCVVYNRHNSDADIKGLSTYYVYGGKELGEPSINTYASLNVSEPYTRFLRRFFSALTDNAAPKRRSRSSVASTTPVAVTETVLWQPISGKHGAYKMTGIQINGFENEWPAINGRSVCLFPVAQSASNKQYAIPAQVNGKDCDIIVLFNERYPKGLVEGARNKDGPIIQKGYNPIEAGDKVAFYYIEMNSDLAISWKKMPPFSVKDTLTLTWDETPPDGRPGQRVTDLRGQVHYTKPEYLCEITRKAG